MASTKFLSNLVVDGAGGTVLDVQGSVGQLFSVTDSLTGDLFAVSDISGIPILNVNSSGAVDIDGTLTIDGVIQATGTGANKFTGGLVLGTPSNGNLVNKLTIASGTVGDGIFLTGLGNTTGMATGNYKAIDFQYSNTDASFQSAIRFVVADSTAHGGQIEFFTDNSSGTNTKALTLDKSQNATFAGDVAVTGGDLTLGTDSIASNINAVGDVLAINVDSNTGGGAGANIQLKTAGTTQLTINSSTATFAGAVTTGGKLYIGTTAATSTATTALLLGAAGEVKKRGLGSNAFSSTSFAPLASPALTGTPTAPTAGATVNTTQLATTAFVQTAIANLAGSAPDTLNTLNELAAALGDDASFSTTVTNSIATKLPLAGGTMTGNLTLSGASSTTAAFIANTGTGSARIYLDASNGDFAGSDYMWIGQNNDLSGEIFMPQSSGSFHIKTQPSGTITSQLSIAQNGTLTLGSYGAGLLKTNASGVVSLDTTAYSTLTIGTTATTAMAGNTAFATTAQGTTADAALPKAGGTMTGDINLGTGSASVKKTANTSGNYPAIEVYSSGTGDSGSAIAIQQATTEGDTIIFADYEPHVEWGISAENNSNEIHFTAGNNAGTLGSKTFKNNAGSDRTAYKKMTVALGSGNVAIGGTLSVTGSISGSNFSGSSSGTNTGDQTLPTLSSLGALSTTAAASTYLPLAGGTLTGTLTAPAIAVTANEGREVQTYMPSSYTTNDLVSGHEYGWYSDHWRLGMTRSGNTAGADFVVQSNGTRKLSLTTGGNLTVTGTVAATNFSGSSSGTNTGDQTLPTLSSLGALSTTGKAADSNLLDGIDSTGFTRKYTFNPGSTASGSRYYVKLFTLDNFDAGVSGILSAAGDYGDPDKAMYHIQIGTRTSLSFDVYQTSDAAVADDYNFYYRQMSNNDYEIWALMADYNKNNNFTVLSQFGTLTFDFDSLTLEDPGDLNQITKYTMYHSGNLTPLVIGTSATTAMAGNTLSAQDLTDIGNLSGTNTGDQSIASIKTGIGTGNGKLVPAAGTAGHFLKHDGTFGVPAYNTYTTSNFDAAGSADAVQSNLDTVAANIAGISKQSNTDVDTGTETIAQVSKGTYTAAFFDFVIKNGTNVRCGTVYSCHDGTNVEFTETSTVDLGDTSDVTLAVDISGTNMRLRATTTSNNWSVKSLVRAI